MNAILATIVSFALLSAPPGPGGDDGAPGISAANGRQADFYLAISDHFHVPPLHVVELHDRYRWADEELPVVYALAALARVAPATIVSLRVRHRSWLEITLELGLTPQVFFVPVHTDPVGPPFGNAYGAYRKYEASREWQRMPLTDQDVVALVNLKFLSEYYGTTPETVMAMRSRESSFVAIHDEIRKGNATHGQQVDRGHGKQK